MDEYGFKLCEECYCVVMTCEHSDKKCSGCGQSTNNLEFTLGNQCIICLFKGKYDLYFDGIEYILNTALEAYKIGKLHKELITLETLRRNTESIYEFYKLGFESKNVN
jgi:hypothetical protein